MRSIKEVIAEKAFYSPIGQKSWNNHMKAFGPILEPAFADNVPARVQLGSALNRIGKKDGKGGLQKLKELEPVCSGNADKAAVQFFMGLCYEQMKKKDNMLRCLRLAQACGPRFYLLHLKLAQATYSEGNYQEAEENYRGGIACLGGGESDAERTLLASSHTNLAGCLLMMHRYDEAEAELKESARLQTNQPGREVTEALLCAARGDKAGVERCLTTLWETDEKTREYVKTTTAQILEGRDPHFGLRKVKDTDIQEFWNWFAAQQKMLRKGITKGSAKGHFDSLLPPIQSRLKLVFPFLEKIPQVGIQATEDGGAILFTDAYSRSLTEGYTRLIKACPGELKDFWRFQLVHYHE